MRTTCSRPAVTSSSTRAKDDAEPAGGLAVEQPPSRGRDRDTPIRSTATEIWTVRPGTACAWACTTVRAKRAARDTSGVRHRGSSAHSSYVSVYSGPLPPSGGVRRPPLAVIAPHWTQFDGASLHLDGSVAVGFADFVDLRRAEPHPHLRELARAPSSGCGCGSAGRRACGCPTRRRSRACRTSASRRAPDTTARGRS